MFTSRQIRNTLTIVLTVTLAATFIATSVLHADTPDYICGDADGSGSVDIDDAVLLINYIFTGGPVPDPIEAGDANASGGVDIDDVVYLIAYIFAGGPEPQCPSDPVQAYPIVDTGQEKCYGTQVEITCPQPGESLYGQDAQFLGNQMSYTNNGDSTITDNITGLTWTKSPDLDGDGDIDIDDKLTFAEFMTYPDDLNDQSFAGHGDWRCPSMKELYSLMNFSGTDPSGPDPSGAIPFIDTAYFDFAYGDEAAGERIIDAQFWSTNVYVGTVFGGQEAAFGLNIADGRIKGYPTGAPVFKVNYVYFVHGNTAYGINDLVDNGDGTITDSATGLMWSQDDSGDGISTGPRSGMTWVDALAWVVQKNNESYLGYNDWRLPNAKEMQSIVDYSRAPDATGSAAIDPVFNITEISNEAGQIDYPWFWTGTTHIRSNGSGPNAAYICFGRGMGYMMSSWLDVHGAGCQRSDGKDGDFTGYNYVSDGYYFGMAPQGDASRQYNYVRLVRDAD